MNKILKGISSAKWLVSIEEVIDFLKRQLGRIQTRKHPSYMHNFIRKKMKKTKKSNPEVIGRFEEIARVGFIGEENGVTVYSMSKRIGKTFSQAFWTRFDELLVRFFEEHPADVVVLLPSFSYTDKSPSKYLLREEIADHIEQISRNATIIGDVIGKLTTLEVLRVADAINSYFRQYWKQQGEDLNKAIERLYYYLEIMDNKCDGYFSYHYIDDKRMKESIIDTMKTLPESYTLYHNVINNKNVLLLDNSLTWQSVNSALSALNSCYLPKSISLISVFSKPNRTC